MPPDPPYVHGRSIEEDLESLVESFSGYPEEREESTVVRDITGTTSSGSDPTPRQGPIMRGEATEESVREAAILVGDYQTARGRAEAVGAHDPNRPAEVSAAQEAALIERMSASRGDGSPLSRSGVAGVREPEFVFDTPTASASDTAPAAATVGVPSATTPNLLQYWRNAGRARVRSLTEHFGEDALVLGHLLFNIPPLAVKISKENLIYKWKPLRSNGVISTKSGNSEVFIEMTLAFVGMRQFNDSLRPLLNIFKKAPICFIENSHIRKMMIPNNPERSMAVGLDTLAVDTVPGTTDALYVSLICRWFNYAPYSNNFYFRKDWRQNGGARSPLETRPSATARATVEEPLAYDYETRPGSDVAPSDEGEFWSDVPDPRMRVDRMIPFERQEEAPDEPAAGGIVDLSALEHPEGMIITQPLEARLMIPSPAVDPSDPLIKPTYPVVYPFNSEAYATRMERGFPTGKRISSWKDSVRFRWNRYFRIVGQPFWRTSQDAISRVATGQERVRAEEEQPTPVEPGRDKIIFVGDEQAGWLTDTSDTAIVALIEDSIFNSRQSDLEFYHLHEASATIDTVRSMVQSIIIDDIFRETEDGDKIAGIVILFPFAAGSGDEQETLSSIVDSINEIGAIAAVVCPTPFKNSSISDPRETTLTDLCPGIVGMNSPSDQIVAINPHMTLSASRSAFDGELKTDYRSSGSPYPVEPNAAGKAAYRSYVYNHLPWTSFRGITESERETWNVCHIQDGDTLFVYNAADEVKAIRLNYIDTLETYYHFLDPAEDAQFPQGQDSGRETDQQWGRMAKEKLQDLIGYPANRSITIDWSGGVDAYNRDLCVIFRGDLNINLELVRTGYAFASGDAETTGDYYAAQQQASGGSFSGTRTTAAVGIHAATISGSNPVTQRIEMPWTWRANHPVSPTGGHDDTPNCPPASGTE